MQQPATAQQVKQLKYLNYLDNIDNYEKISTVNINMKSSLVHGKQHHQLKLQSGEDQDDSDYGGKGLSSGGKFLDKLNKNEFLKAKPTKNSRNDYNLAIGSNSWMGSNNQQSKEQTSSNWKQSSNGQNQPILQSGYNTATAFNKKKSSLMKAAKSAQLQKIEGRQRIRSKEFQEFYRDENVFSDFNRPAYQNKFVSQLREELNDQFKSKNLTAKMSYSLGRRVQTQIIESGIIDKQSKYLKKVTVNALSDYQRNVFDQEEYEGIRDKMKKLKGRHHLLRAAVNKSMNSQDRVIQSQLMDKQLNLPQMNKTYHNVRKIYGDRNRETYNQTEVSTAHPSGAGNEPGGFGEINYKSSGKWNYNSVFNSSASNRNPQIDQSPKKSLHLKQQHSLRNQAKNSYQITSNNSQHEYMDAKQYQHQQQQQHYDSNGEDYIQQNFEIVKDDQGLIINQELAAEDQYQTMLDQIDLKKYKYFGGEEKLNDINGIKDPQYQHKLDIEEINRYIREKSEKMRNYRQQMDFINKKAQSKWMKQRENKSSLDIPNGSGKSNQKNKDKDIKESLEIMEKLFLYWDTLAENQITMEQLNEKLIIFGLAPNEKMTESIIKLVKFQHKLDQNATHIKRHQFLSLFQFNRFLQPVIDLIIKKFQDLKIQEELMQKQQQLKSKQILSSEVSQNKRPSNSNTVKINSKIEPLSPVSSSKKDRQNSSDKKQSSKSTLNDSQSKLKHVKINSIPNDLSPINEEKYKQRVLSPIRRHNQQHNRVGVSEAYQMIQQFWNECDGAKSNEIKKDSLMAFLRSNRIVADKFQFDEFMKFMLITDDLTIVNTINKPQFLIMFCKPIFMIGIGNALHISRLQQAKGSGLLSNIDPLSCQIVNHQRDMLYSSFDTQPVHGSQIQSPEQQIKIPMGIGAGIAHKVAQNLYNKSIVPHINQKDLITAMSDIQKKQTTIDINLIREEFQKQFTLTKQRELQRRITQNMLNSRSQSLEKLQII
ncbi:UNKNOWN [Stylonychia lemnae]|uniref:EF-hand domain-containing protein n=1 Tax=Stylonychia lemnae TaxID=5949 RepID=A0A078BD48_STYLE|nr:UNKNOWN [Stylonychia lemnae]|eukprot:CDW91508.1 UNKNOWN [Stylonychia lemnae]